MANDRPRCIVCNEALVGMAGDCKCTNQDYQDLVHKYQSQQAQEEINREAYRQDLIDWEHTVIHKMEDMSVWLVHLFQTLSTTDMPINMILALLQTLMAQYIAHKGGADFFTTMPDVNRLIGETVYGSMQKDPDKQED